MPELDSPIKALFISVFDMVGNQLASSVGEGLVSVVSFRYKYDDEDDDICTIKLQMANPTALDSLKIERGTKLQLIYGYLGNPVSPVSTVLVRDMTSKYGDNIIYTELQCTDYLTWLKTQRSSDVIMGTILEYIKAQVYGQFNIVIQDRGQRIYDQSIRIEGEEYDELLLVTQSKNWAKYSGNVFFDPYSNNPSKSTELGLVKGDPGIGKWYVGDANIIKKYLEEDRSIPTSNRSIYVIISDLFKKCPRGPWFVTGRGSTLLIHNRDLGKAIYKEYKYMDEPTDLMDFTAKTKFENFDKQAISYTGMDPKDRKNYYILDYRKALFAQRNPKEILDDKKITDVQRKAELTEYFNLRLQSYAKWGVDRTEGFFLYPGTERQIWFPGNPGKPYVRKHNAVPHGAIDNTGQENPDPAVRKSGGGFDENEDDRILRAAWYTLPLESFEDAVNVTNNRQRELEMDKEEAQVILVGDPWIKSENTIRVTNVHSQHEGHYYIKKCEHIITNQGFKTQLDCIKVIPESLITTLTLLDKEEYNKYDDDVKTIIENQFKREQSIFGADVKVTYKMEDRIIQKGGAEKEAPVLGTVYETLSFGKMVFEDGIEVDEAIDKLIEISKRPDAMIGFNPENR